jgi:hypothetical protein
MIEILAKDMESGSNSECSKSKLTLSGFGGPTTFVFEL